MAFTGLLIGASAILLLLDPTLTATELLGGQGMLFCTIAVIRGVWFAVRERETLMTIWKSGFKA